MSDPHDITFTPGFDTVTDLERKGETWSRYLANEAIPLIDQASEMPLPPEGVKKCDALIQKFIRKNWRRVIGDVKAALPPEQAQIFEDAATRGLNTRLSEHQATLKSFIEQFTDKEPPVYLNGLLAPKPCIFI